VDGQAVKGSWMGAGADLFIPLRRARQTAQIIADLFDIPFEIEPALGDAFDPETLLHLMPPVEEDATIFLVGHAPSLGNFVNQLAGNDALPTGMAKSSAAVVSFSEHIAFGKGRLIHYLAPDKD